MAGTTNPAGAPLEAVLKVSQKTYRQDPGGKSAAAIRKQLDAAATSAVTPRCRRSRRPQRRRRRRGGVGYLTVTSAPFALKVIAK